MLVQYPEMGKSLQLQLSMVRYSELWLRPKVNIHHCAMFKMSSHIPSLELFLKRKRRREEHKESATTLALPLVPFCNWIIVNVSRTRIWVYFCEWLHYQENETQEIIKSCLLYSHICLQWVCWNMTSKMTVIQEVIFFDLDSWEHHQAYIFLSHTTYQIGPKQTRTGTCDLCICNRGRGPVLSMRSLMQ